MSQFADYQFNDNLFNEANYTRIDADKTSFVYSSSSAIETGTGIETATKTVFVVNPRTSVERGIGLDKTQFISGSNTQFNEAGFNAGRFNSSGDDEQIETEFVFKVKKASETGIETISGQGTGFVFSSLSSVEEGIESVVGDSVGIGLVVSNGVGTGISSLTGEKPDLVFESTASTETGIEVIEGVNTGFEFVSSSTKEEVFLLITLELSGSVANVLSGELELVESLDLQGDVGDGLVLENEVK